MNSIVTLLLTLVGQLLPVVGASGIQKIVNALEAITPDLMQEAVSLVPIVQSIIAALKNNPATTDAQTVMLNDLDARCAAAFEGAEVKPQASEPPAPAASTEPPASTAPAPTEPPAPTAPASPAPS